MSFHLQLLAAAGKRLDVIVTITTRKLSLGLRKGKHIKLTQNTNSGGSKGWPAGPRLPYESSGPLWPPMKLVAR